MDTLHDLLEDELNEELSRKYRVSEKAEKLVQRLEKKRNDLEDLLDDKNLPKEKIKEVEENIFAINKSIPAIEKFIKYFKKLEKNLEKLPREQKRKRLEAKYNEIRELFIKELYSTMSVVGYGAATILATTIATIAFLFLVTIPIPGTGPILIAPSVLMLKKLREVKQKVGDNKEFEKEIDKLIERLERKKRRTLRSY